MGVPQARWLVYFTESPKQKWMIWGYPYLRKPPTLSKPQGVLPVSLVFLINSLISLSLRAHVAGSEYPLG